MSTAMITTGSTVRTASTRPARLHLTRRGRVVFTTLAAVPLLIGIGLVALNGGQAVAGNESAHTSFQTVTMQPGESLWQLAEQQAPNADPREFVQDVVDLNNLQGAGVQAGQQIAIPAEYATGR